MWMQKAIALVFLMSQPILMVNNSCAEPIEIQREYSEKDKELIPFFPFGRSSCKTKLFAPRSLEAMVILWLSGFADNIKEIEFLKLESLTGFEQRIVGGKASFSIETNNGTFHKGYAYFNLCGTIVGHYIENFSLPVLSHFRNGSISSSLIESACSIKLDNEKQFSSVVTLWGIEKGLNLNFSRMKELIPIKDSEGSLIGMKVTAYTYFPDKKNKLVFTLQNCKPIHYEILEND